MRWLGPITAAALAALVLQASGCGGADKSNAPPAQAPGGGAPAQYNAPHDEDGTREQQEKTERDSTGNFAEPPPSGTTAPGLGGEQQPTRTITTLAEAQAAFERDVQAISSALSAGKDCDRACKAFGSMDRSSQKICELNGVGDPDERCKKAKERVDTARARLQRVCGGC